MTRVLYLGTDPSRYGRDVVHCPLIETKPLPLSEHLLDQWEEFTHILLTSPNAARIMTSYKNLDGKKIIAIGKGTADVIGNCFAIANPETQEGMIDLLKSINLSRSYILYPRSSKARPLLASYLNEANIRHHTCNLYETLYLKPNPIPDLAQFDEIVFTSPSTVHAFLEIYGSIPQDKHILAIGPVTDQALKVYQETGSAGFG
jgi:uroporphyrinogen-III synthase